VSNCTTCGGFLRDPFDLSSTSSSGCQCNTGGLVTEGAALPTDTCCVSSVNGQVGIVNLTTANVPAATGYSYYSNALVAAFISASTPLSFNTSTGVISHNTSGVTAGTYGSSSVVPVITVNSTGHITSVTTQSISSVSIGADLTAIENLTGTGYLIRTGTNTWALRSLTGAAGQITLTNPAGTAGATLISLAASGVSAGTYGGPLSFPIITVDSFGRVTNVTNQSISTPSTVPPHTHSLGNLSNVDDIVDTGASVGQTIVWDGSQYTLGTPQVAFINTTLSLYGSWKFASNAGTDTNQINTVRKLVDVNEFNIVTVHAVLYLPISAITFTTLASNKYLEEMQVATVPSGYRPFQYVHVPLAATLNSRAYYDTGHTTTFNGYQVVNNLNVGFKPDGNVFVTMFVSNADYNWATLSGVTHLIVPIICTYVSREVG